MGNRPIHQYEVELARHVNSPEYGPCAYYTSYQRTSFPFGRGHAIKTGAEALKKAEEFARANMDRSSRVSITKFRGYSGSTTYLKDDPDSRFVLPL